MKPGNMRTEFSETGVRVILDLTETRWNGVEWIHLAQDRDKWRAFLNKSMNLRVSEKNFFASSGTVSFSKKHYSPCTYRHNACTTPNLGINTQVIKRPAFKLPLL